MGDPAVILDRRKRTLDEASPGRPPSEAFERERGDLEELSLAESRLEAVRNSMTGADSPPSAPVEPAEAPAGRSEELRQRAEAGPIPTTPNESLFHPVSEDVPDTSEQGAFVQHRLGRISAFPEGSFPVDQHAHLLRDVREEVLHELRKVPPRSANQHVDVVRGKAEPEELDGAPLDGTCQDASDDVVRLQGWAKQETRLGAPHRNEIDQRLFLHPQRPAHASPPFRGNARARTRPWVITRCLTPGRTTPRRTPRRCF